MVLRVDSKHICVFEIHRSALPSRLQIHAQHQISDTDVFVDWIS